MIPKMGLKVSDIAFKNNLKAFGLCVALLSLTVNLESIFAQTV
jgi:hypothetical protein